MTRLAVCGATKDAEKLRARMETFRRNQSPDGQALLRPIGDAPDGEAEHADGFFVPLLRWAERLALVQNGTTPLWRPDAHVAAFYRRGAVAGEPAPFRVTSRFFAPQAEPAEREPDGDGDVHMDEPVMLSDAMAEWQARRPGKRKAREPPNALGGGVFHE